MQSDKNDGEGFYPLWSEPAIPDMNKVMISESGQNTEYLDAGQPVFPLPVILEGRWYVAHTRSRNEKMLAFELSRLNIHNYLPLVNRVTRSPVTRRLSHSEVPVFPGYVFFYGTEEQRYHALRTNRIANVLHVPNQTQLVTELTHIHLLLARSEDFTVAQHLGVGDWVRIIAGPLQGLEGVIACCTRRWRLHINVTTLGQSVIIEVSEDNVERIEPPAHPSKQCPPIRCPTRLTIK
jgi:transcription antitermination factor NusG